MATVADTKGDGVDEPQEVDPSGQDEVVSADTSALCLLVAFVEGAHGEDEVRHSAERKETPLVGGQGQGGNEVWEDPEPSNGHVASDGGPRDTAGQAKTEGERRKGDEPVGVSGKEEGGGRGLAVVADGTNENSDGEEVVEDSLAFGDDEAEGQDGQLKGLLAEKLGGVSSRTYKGDDMDGRHSPEPVDPMIEKGLVILPIWVDGKNLVENR